MSMKKLIKIDGMQCEHCKMRVEKALSSLENIESVEVSLENKNAIITSNVEISDNAISEAITDMGFEVKEIELC